MDNHVNTLPLSLRRTPRRSVKKADPINVINTDKTPSKTPSKTRGKKRVRFSDPGPNLVYLEDDDVTRSEASTGLTPMVRRSNLGDGTPSSKRRRRHSSPIRNRESESSSHPTKGFSNVIHFPSLRQVLDERVKRRIRRNGLSEEMNIIDHKKRTQAQEQKAELQRLRSALAEKDEEIEQLRDTTVLYDTDRIVELQSEIDTLRSQLLNRSSPIISTNNTVEGDTTMEMSSPSGCFDWTMAARDPFSDTFLDHEEGEGTEGDKEEREEFNDSSMQDIVCSTPSRRARASFPTPPATSPMLPPLTPSSSSSSSKRKRNMMTTVTMPATPQSSSSAAIQADLPDEEKEAMEVELGSLRLKLTELKSKVDAHQTFKQRLSSKLADDSVAEEERDIIGNPQTTATATTTMEQDHHQIIESRLTTLLTNLSDRTAALQTLTTSLTSLGFFPPSSSSSSSPDSSSADVDSANLILHHLSRTLRTCRLELERLSPGECPLPLTTPHQHGDQLLSEMLSRLQTLTRQVSEADSAIDEYHSLELSLRQQLGVRVDFSRKLEGENSRLKEEVEGLKIGLERWKGCAGGYREEVEGLERLVGRMEEEFAASQTKQKEEMMMAEKKRREETEREMEEEQGKMAQLVEKEVERMEGIIRSLEQEVEKARADWGLERREMNAEHGKQLALRDARVGELRGEVERVNGQLREQLSKMQGLRIENGGLRERLRGAEGRVGELEGLLFKGSTTSSSSRRVTRSSSAEKKAAKEKRLRKCDSGIGLAEEAAAEEEEDGDDDATVEMVGV